MKSHLLLAVFFCLLLDSNVLAQTSKESYGTLPLSFEPNQGQTDPKVKFLSRGSGYTLFLTPNEAVFSLTKPQKKPSAGRHELFEKPVDVEQRRTTVLRMRLLGANPAPEVIGVNELPGKSNYRSHGDHRKIRDPIARGAQHDYGLQFTITSFTVGLSVPEVLPDLNEPTRQPSGNNLTNKKR